MTADAPLPPPSTPEPATVTPVPTATSRPPSTAMAIATVAELSPLLSELQALTLTVWGEARNQGDKGMLGVAQVILNRRATGRWGPTINAVVFARRQFSCWAPLGGAENFSRLMAMTGRVLSGAQVSQLRHAERISRGVLEGSLPNVVGPATHYVTVGLWQDPRRQEWIKRAREVTRINDHVFLVER